MQKLAFFLLMIPLVAISQNKLVIKLEGIKSSSGNLNIGVYSKALGFLKSDKAFAGVFVKAELGTTIATIDNLPNGTYALAVFHDQNANKKLDTNFLGIPNEPLGFSKGKLKTFGPPSFKECAFEMDKSMELTVLIN